MSEELAIALLITLVGMGLVFGTILLFWLLTRVLVRVTWDEADLPEEDARGTGIARSSHLVERDLKRRAAVVAVAMALAQQEARYQERPQPFPLPPTALVSTWQAVMRARLLGRQRPSR